MTLVATDERDRIVGVLSVTAPQSAKVLRGPRSSTEDLSSGPALAGGKRGIPPGWTRPCRRSRTPRPSAPARPRQGAKYTQALRNGAGDRPAAASASGDDGFGGHEFEYEQVTDLFRCTECGVYEVTARDTDGPIKPCTGLAGYGGDTERVYLLLTENPALPYSHVAALAMSIRSTGIGRAPRFSWRDGRLLVESAPSVVADLARRIELITFAVGGRQVPAVSSVDHLTAEAGQIIIAENYAAYAAEYGRPRSQGATWWLRTHSGAHSSLPSGAPGACRSRMAPGARSGRRKLQAPCTTRCLRTRGLSRAMSLVSDCARRRAA
jgi:hypothetical protein